MQFDLPKRDARGQILTTALQQAFFKHISVVLECLPADESSVDVRVHWKLLLANARSLESHLIRETKSYASAYWTKLREPLLDIALGCIEILASVFASCIGLPPRSLAHLKDMLKRALTMSRMPVLMLQTPVALFRERLSCRVVVTQLFPKETSCRDVLIKKVHAFLGARWAFEMCTTPEVVADSIVVCAQAASDHCSSGEGSEVSAQWRRMRSELRLMSAAMKCTSAQFADLCMVMTSAAFMTRITPGSTHEFRDAVKDLAKQLKKPLCFQQRHTATFRLMLEHRLVVKQLMNCIGSSSKAWLVARILNAFLETDRRSAAALVGMGDGFGAYHFQYQFGRSRRFVQKAMEPKLGPSNTHLDKSGCTR